MIFGEEASTNSNNTTGMNFWGGACRVRGSGSAKQAKATGKTIDLEQEVLDHEPSSRESASTGSLHGRGKSRTQMKDPASKSRVEAMDTSSDESETDEAGFTAADTNMDMVEIVNGRTQNWATGRTRRESKKEKKLRRHERKRERERKRIARGEPSGPHRISAKRKAEEQPEVRPSEKPRKAKRNKVTEHAEGSDEGIVLVSSDKRNPETTQEIVHEHAQAQAQQTQALHALKVPGAKATTMEERLKQRREW